VQEKLQSLCRSQSSLVTSRGSAAVAGEDTKLQELDCYPCAGCTACQRCNPALLQDCLDWVQHTQG
jgi:hypothetical protein